MPKMKRKLKMPSPTSDPDSWKQNPPIHCRLPAPCSVKHQSFITREKRKRLIKNQWNLISTDLIWRIRPYLRKISLLVEASRVNSLNFGTPSGGDFLLRKFRS